MKNKCSGPAACAHVEALAPYVPGLSISEIAARYGLTQVIKLASNENPLGASPLVQEAIRRHASEVFRYPQSGNPRLCQAIARLHGLKPENIVVGNGSDELIDLLMRVMALPGQDNVVCFRPCFGIYPVQAVINNLELRRQPLKEDFSFDFDGLLPLVDDKTRLVFITTPDNPSGYCPSMPEVAKVAEELAKIAPRALLVIDEAYMDFTENEKGFSLLANHKLPPNVAFLRTFSKSWGLAGLRIGYMVIPAQLANVLWRARLPFSVNILAEEAAMAALQDHMFRECCLETVKKERKWLSGALEDAGCKVYPSGGNFIMFALPADSISTKECFESLLRAGIIIRMLGSYDLPDLMRVSIGRHDENMRFILTLKAVLDGVASETVANNHN